MEGNAAEGMNLPVLLVEDNPDHAELVSRRFHEELADGRLFHVSDGEQALKFLKHEGAFSQRDSSPRPALIFLDLRLPRLDGLSLLRTIKNDAKLSSIPVTVLTTSTAASDIAGACANGANACLAKPLRTHELRSHLKSAAKAWLRRNQTDSESASR